MSESVMASDPGQLQEDALRVTPGELVAFDAALLPMALTRLDGSLVRVNPAWIATFGYTVSELQGKSPFEGSNLTPAVFERGLARIASGRSVREPLTIETKGGERIAMHVSARGMPDASGALSYIVATFLPFREREGNEAGVRAAGSSGQPGEKVDLTRSELAEFDAAPLAMLLADIDGTVVRVNAAWTRLFGFTTADVADRTVAEVTGAPPELVDSVRNTLLAGQTVRDLVRENLTVDGRTVRVRSSISLFGSGAPRYVLATAIPMG